MKKGAASFIFLTAITLLLVSMPIVSAQTYSGFSKFVDNIKLVFSSGEGKVMLALEIREKELNSAIENAKVGNNEDAIKNLEAAKDKLKIVQKRISPDVAEEVRSNVGEIEKRINENKNVNLETTQYFNEYLKEEEKTKLFVNLSEKTFDYCKELASQNYDLMIKDEKCKSYSWMEGIVRERVEEERAEDIEKIKKEVSACMNNPKECNCDEISLASEKSNCEKYKSSAVRCEFQGDSSACGRIKDIKGAEEIKGENEQTRQELEKQIMEKYLPAECSEAGVRDGEECKKLILTLNQPKSACMENGEYVGEENCKEKLVKEGNVVQECVVNGKLVDPSECLNNVKEANKPARGELELMSGECKERGVYDPIACDEIVNLPRPCKDAGYYTKKECEIMTLNQNLPKECVDAGALTPEACEKLKLPSDCQGAFSREECEKIKIEQKFPEECKSEGELDPKKCAVIMIGKESLVVTAGAEMEYLVRQGLTFEEIPGICMNGKNFIRSMDCDAELAKLRITLPPPSDTSNIPMECMVDGVPVSPLECQGKLEKKIVIDTIPKECQDAEFTNPEECGGFMEEKRIEEGIGINMPSECMGESIEECKTIMQEKGIEIKKIEQVGEITLPRECLEMGVSDVKDCEMVAGRINEERIKNGEKIIVDEKGKIEYINPEQIEKIADDSEKASQNIKPDFEKAEEIKQEINDLEENMNQIGESTDKENNIVIDGRDSEKQGSVRSEGESDNVVQQQNEIRNEVQNEVSSSEGSRNIVVENSGGESNSVSESSSDSGGSSSSEGESAPVTGAVIGSENRESFLVKILKKIFRI
jgi:hypothetical protein